MTIFLRRQAIDLFENFEYNTQRKKRCLNLSDKEQIHQKGFDMSTPRAFEPEGNVIPNIDYSKIKVGMKQLVDATLDLGSYKRLNGKMTKENIQRAIVTNNIAFMREASDFYFSISGIYARLCKHLANFYRYDWFATIGAGSGKANPEKLKDAFYQNIWYIDKFNVKKFFGEVALKVMRHGCYYGYRIDGPDYSRVQELAPKYCRSRFKVNGKPAVEFQMKYFDEEFKDIDTRLRILNMFPQEFKKGYLAYREGKLPPQFTGDAPGWYLLDPLFAFKFNINDEDCPPFASVIPHLIDLEAAQELDRKKMAQKLVKILIQKMPLDKNGDLIFDIDEAQQLHNNAVKMLGKAIGIDVLTTFADVEVADLADRASVTSIDELEKVERTVYNESGTAQNLFNTDGNIALEKSILDDEANVYNLLLQFEEFLNDMVKHLMSEKSKKKMYFKVQILPTTIYNYKDMSKLYKEQAAMGYSKQLAAIALGQSQAMFLANTQFENEILDVSSMMQTKQQKEEARAKAQSSTQAPAPRVDKEPVVEKKPVGRQEKPDDQKSEKTIKNREAMS